MGECTFVAMVTGPESDAQWAANRRKGEVQVLSCWALPRRSVNILTPLVGKVVWTLFNLLMLDVTSVLVWFQSRDLTILLSVRWPMETTCIFIRRSKSAHDYAGPWRKRNLQYCTNFSTVWIITVALYFQAILSNYLKGSYVQQTDRFQGEPLGWKL